MRSLLCSASLALLAALCSAQATYRQDYGPGFAANVAANGTRQIIDTANSQSFVVNPNGSFAYSNAGYTGAAGISATRQALGVSDPSFLGGAFPRGFVRDGLNSDYPLTLYDGEYAGVLTSTSTRFDPFGGRVAFMAINSDGTAVKSGVDTGNGPATEFASDGVFGTAALSIESISSTLTAGTAYETDGSVRAWWNDGSFHALSLASGQTVRQMALSVTPGLDQFLSVIVDDGSGSTHGGVYRLNADGTSTDTGLWISGVSGVSGNYGDLGVFWSSTKGLGVDIPTGIQTAIVTGGGLLTGIDSMYASQGNVLTINGSFGSGQAYVAPVPEPATLAALGCGLLALRRRGRSS